MAKRLIVPIWTDTHSGYSFGMLPEPPAERNQLPPLDDNNGRWWPEPTATQEQLRQWAQEDIERTLEIAGPSPIFLLHLGDVVQGTWLPNQLLSVPRLIDQYIIAEETMAMWLRNKKVRGVRFVKGSGVHVQAHGTAELAVARMLSKRYPSKDIAAWYHQMLDLDGVLFDIAHHGPNKGSRDWLEGNILRYYMRSIVQKMLKAGERPPDVILRGHYHDRAFEVLHTHLVSGETVKTFGAICPAYSLFTDDYTIKATKSKGYMTAGTVVIEIVEGRLKDIYDLTRTVDIRKHEEVRVE